MTKKYIKRGSKLWDKEWLHEQYHTERLSIVEIADKIGCSVHAVGDAMKRFSISLRTSSEAHTLCSLKRWKKERANNPFLNDKDWLYQHYIIKKDGIEEIAKRINIGYRTVTKHLLEFGIPIREQGKCNRERQGKTNIEKYKFLDDKEWLYKKYWEEKLSIREITMLIGCDSGIVWDALKRHNIKRRTTREAIDAQSLEVKAEKRAISRKTRRTQKMPHYHTRPELVFEKICAKYDLHFKYVGDSSLWIGKERKALNPDFIQADGQKIVVEIMGDWWHSPLLNQKVPAYANLKYREKHYKKFGWRSVFLWETDLLRVDADQFVLLQLQKNGVI